VRFPVTQDLFDDREAPGLARQPDFLVLNWGLFLSFTDTPGNPHAGGVLGVSVSRFDERAGSEFDFTRLSIDARHYLPLGSRQRVLATRFFGSFDDPGQSGRVPFYLQTTLGGAAALRGWPEFRFRDANAVYFSAEYRWEPAPAFEIALFHDAGKVYPTGAGFSFRQFERSTGIGFRFKTARRTILRFDIGRSREGARLQFRFGPAF
jgi:outer membrane protein assembly factor BamA